MKAPGIETEIPAGFTQSQWLWLHLGGMYGNQWISNNGEVPEDNPSAMAQIEAMQPHQIVRAVHVAALEGSDYPPSIPKLLGYGRSTQHDEFTPKPETLQIEAPKILFGLFETEGKKLMVHIGFQNLRKKAAWSQEQCDTAWQTVMSLAEKYHARYPTDTEQENELPAYRQKLESQLSEIGV